MEINADEITSDGVQVNVNKDLRTVTLKGTKVEIGSEGNVLAFTDKGVQVKPATADAAAKKEGTSIDIGKDFNTVAMYGATVELAADGSLIVSTNGKVTVKPTPANDAAAAQVALILGQEMPDHSIYAGLTANGKQQIFAIPKDLYLTLTFNDAAKGVESLNADKALGHNDWQIGSLEVTRVPQKNQNEGKLKGTFNTSGNKGSGSDCPVWYWSSTEDRFDSSFVRVVRFSDGDENWNLKDNFRLGCRPVRLVPA